MPPNARAFRITWSVFSIRANAIRPLVLPLTRQDLIQEIHGRGKRVVIVGGTGFYIRSLCGEMRLGEGFDAQLRTRMQREQALHDPVWLYEWLCIRDPRRAAMLDARDAYRVVRALEQSLSAPIAADAATESLPTLPTLGFERQKFWLRQPADILESRIAQRTTRMLDAGLLAEAERIGVGAVAASAVGYEHVFGYLAGQSTGPELVAAISRGTRQYAKRQRTWLRREPDLMSVPATTSLDAWRELAEAHCGWAG